MSTLITRFYTSVVTLILVTSLIQASLADPPTSDSPEVRNTKARLIRVIHDLQSGSPDMNQFEPMLRIAVQQQKDRTNTYFAYMGQLKDVTFVGSQNGGDVFQVTFEHGVSGWWIQIAPNGNIAGLSYQ
jgi:hypothetical protein